MRYRVISRSRGGQRAEIVVGDGSGSSVTRHVHREADGNWYWRQGEGPHAKPEVYEPDKEIV